MADIINNKLGGSVTVVARANTNLSLANLASSVAETVTGATVGKILYSTSTPVTIARGANTIAVLSGNGEWLLNSYGLPFTQYPAANVAITIADATSTVVLELSKTSTYNDGGVYSNGGSNS